MNDKLMLYNQPDLQTPDCKTHCASNIKVSLLIIWIINSSSHCWAVYINARVDANAERRRHNSALCKYAGFCCALEQGVKRCLSGKIHERSALLWSNRSSTLKEMSWHYSGITYRSCIDRCTCFVVRFAFCSEMRLLLHCAVMQACTDVGFASISACVNLLWGLSRNSSVVFWSICLPSDLWLCLREQSNSPVWWIHSCPLPAWNADAD